MSSTRFCACGCGMAIPPAAKNGRPRRFVHGHNGRVRPPYQGPPQYCECGCGELAPIATRSRAAQGHKVGYPTRFISGHGKRKKRGPRYVVENRGYPSPCWIWQGVPAGDNGYGRVRSNGKYQPAHRVYWEQRHGPVPDGLQLDHLCRVPLCVNPDHLEAVTGTENVRRGLVPKLTLDRAAAIRAEVAAVFTRLPLNTRGEPRKRLPQGVLGEIAGRYGVSKLTVIAVVKNRSWK